MLEFFVGHAPHRRGARPPGERPHHEASRYQRRRGADLYFVTEWQDGQELHEWRHSRRSVLDATLERLGLLRLARRFRALRHPPARVLLRPIVQVAGGLDALHEQGLVHSDVKPANIIVHRNRGVLVDYGSLLRIARRPIAITRDYAPPEGHRGQVAGDRFSLACVAFFLVSGQSPAVNGEPGSGPNVSGMLRALERNPLVRGHDDFHRLMREALQPVQSPLAPGAVGDWASALQVATAGWAAPFEVIRAKWSFRPFRRLGRRVSGVLSRDVPLPPTVAWVATVALAVAAWLALVAGVERIALATGTGALALWWLLRGPRSRLLLAAGVMVLLAFVGAVLRVASWVDDVPPPTTLDNAPQTTDPPPSQGGVETQFQSGATDLPGPVLLSDAALVGPGESAFRALPSAADELVVDVERYAYTGSADGVTVSVEVAAANEGSTPVPMALDQNRSALVLLVAGSVDEPWNQAQVAPVVTGYRATGRTLRPAPVDVADVLVVPPAPRAATLPYGASPVDRWETAWDDSPLAAGRRRGGRADVDDRLTFSVPAPDEGAIRVLGLTYVALDGEPVVFASSADWGPEGDPYTYQIAGEAVHEEDIRPGECVEERINSNPYRAVVPC